MIAKLYDVSLEQALAEHYLFDLGQSVEKTAEILGKDKGFIRKIHDDYARTINAMGRKAK